VFHLGVFDGSAAGAVTDQDTAFVADQFMPVLNTHAAPPYRMRLVGAHAYGATLTFAKLSSPYLRMITPPYIRPLDVAATPNSRPGFSELFRQQVYVNPAEELQFLASASGVGGTTCGVWFSDGNMMLPVGKNDYLVKATATITAAAGAWTNGVITLQSGLPAGRYSVLGMSCYGTNIDYARLVFPGQTPRPGVIGQQSAAGIDGYWQFGGILGEFGQFDSIAQPTLDVFSHAGNGSQTVQLFIEVRLVGQRQTEIPVTPLGVAGEGVQP
jgi:hypothetical protein